VPAQVPPHQEPHEAQAHRGVGGRARHRRLQRMPCIFCVGPGACSQVANHIWRPMQVIGYPGVIICEGGPALAWRPTRGVSFVYCNGGSSTLQKTPLHSTPALQEQLPPARCCECSGWCLHVRAVDASLGARSVLVAVV